jgi:DNA-damage-inducible protein D
MQRVGEILEHKIMDKQRIVEYKKIFDNAARYIDNGIEHVEIWFARDLQTVLGYARWENFNIAVQRAAESCKTQGWR